MRAVRLYSRGMSGAELGIALSVFLACAVEAVEAFTIVLAVGQTRSWPSALGGAAAAVVVLAAVIAALGGAVNQIPIESLRLGVGLLLLLVGLQWLRKAILRAAGRKALHDEQKIFEEETAAAVAAGRPDAGFDPYSFIVAGKGVLLEGFEVVLIAITIGAAHHRTGLAAVAAFAAVAVVVVAGFAVRAPLARVPENTLKFAVGVMLCTYGIFWTAEGAGADWPGGDAMLLAILPCVLLASLLTVALLRQPRLARPS
jgi:uncharacterized membrane protein